ncbi:MAG: cation diffusion facilitator family transporter [Lachnospiraceae bacterium]|nr:cation diffusion facilitator family transporter [Lachnospiraceae bacterium]
MSKKDNNLSETLKQPVSQEEANRVIAQVSAVGIGGNVALSAFKLFAGIFGKSGAMISDAVHSLSDVFATFIALVGVKIADKGADKGHPYGHERMECVAALLLSAILIATGASIGYTGISNIAKGVEIATPGVIALVAAIVSIVTKEAMFWYTLACAKKINSAAFRADAWHHRSDALSSIGALIGIAGARMGFPILDSVASIVICLFIFKVAYEICTDAVNKMVDKACPEEFEKEIRELIDSDEQVVRVDKLNTRMFGEKVYVDAEIALDCKMTLMEAHDVAQRVHDSIEQKYPNIKHVMVHMNPAHMQCEHKTKK